MMKQYETHFSNPATLLKTCRNRDEKTRKMSFLAIDGHFFCMIEWFQTGTILSPAGIGRAEAEHMMKQTNDTTEVLR